MINKYIGFHRAGKRAIVVAMSLSLIYAPLTAALKFTEVSTDELSEMRGKFVSKENRVSYFGLSMQTRWERGGSDTHYAGMRWELKKTDNGYKTRYSKFARGKKQQDVEQLSGPSQALTQITGSVQSTRIEGSNNQVDNNVALDVVKDTADTPMVLGVTAGTQKFFTEEIAAESNPEQKITTYQTEDGVTTQFTSGGALGFTIESEGSKVVQMVGVNPVTSTRQLLQSVDLHGNRQHIVNNIRLQVGLENTNRVRQSVRRHSLLGLM